VRTTAIISSISCTRAADTSTAPVLTSSLTYSVTCAESARTHYAHLDYTGVTAQATVLTIHCHTACLQYICAHNYGLNTKCAGGMGAYAPAPCLTPGLSKICAAVCQQTVEAMAKEVQLVGTLKR
jgi:Phosphoribosylglycinamide synthetase, ATP-grasp (A) domain